MVLKDKIIVHTSSVYIVEVKDYPRLFGFREGSSAISAKRLTHCLINPAPHDIGRKVSDNSTAQNLIPDYPRAFT